MKRLIPFGVSALAAILFSAAPAAAQGTGGFQFGLSGGASFPTSDWSDAYGTGYNGGIVLNYELPALPLGLRVDGDYRNFSAKTFGAFTRSAEIFDGNANLVLGIRIVVVKVYVIGGAGIYNVRFKAESAGVSSSTSSTDFGWNAGAGVAFVVGKVSIFGEGRYHEVSLCSDCEKFKFVAVSAGVLF